MASHFGRGLARAGLVPGRAWRRAPARHPNRVLEQTAQGREGRCALRHSGQLWNCSAAQNWSLGCAGSRERELLCFWGTAVRHRQAARDGRCGRRVVGLAGAAVRESRRRACHERSGGAWRRGRSVAGVKFLTCPEGWWRPSLEGGWRELVSGMGWSGDERQPGTLTEFWSRRRRVGKAAVHCGTAADYGTAPQLKTGR